MWRAGPPATAEPPPPAIIPVLRAHRAPPTWEPSSRLERAHLLGGLRELVLETAGFPDLKLVTETDERHRLGNARMTLQVLAQHHTPLAVDLQRLAGAVERESKLLALVGERA